MPGSYAFQKDLFEIFETHCKSYSVASCFGLRELLYESAGRNTLSRDMAPAVILIALPTKE